MDALANVMQLADAVALPQLSAAAQDYVSLSSAALPVACMSTWRPPAFGVRVALAALKLTSLEQAGGGGCHQSLPSSLRQVCVLLQYIPGERILSKQQQMQPNQ